MARPVTVVWWTPQIVDFIQDWRSLSATQRRSVMDKPISTPLQRYLTAGVTGSTQRYDTSPAVASTEACTRCRGRLPEQHVVLDVAPASSGHSPPAAPPRPLRFCSTACVEQYQLRRSGTVIRARLYELEKGVCQMCNLNADELYRQVRVPPSLLRVEAWRDVLVLVRVCRSRH